MIVTLLLIRTWSCRGGKALGDEFGFFLTCLLRLCLFENLATAGASFSRDFELAHVFAVAFDFFSLGVDATSRQEGRRTVDTDGW